MKNLLNKFGLQRLIVAAITAISSVCMWGCDYLKNDPVLLDSGCRQDPGFVMVSDTAAVVPLHCYDHYENNLDDWKECSRMGLKLKNIKSGKKYWEEMVDYCSQTYEYVVNPIGSLSDSTVFWVFVNNETEFSYLVWKIGEDAVMKKALWKSENIGLEQTNVIIRFWKGGKLLFKNRDDFALLDTVENTITRVTKEEAGWPDGVEDAQYFGDDMMTLHFVSEDRCDFAILKNSVDTLSVHREDSCPYFVKRDLDFSWKYVVRSEESKFVFSIDSSWLISDKPIAKYKNNQFQKLEE